MFPPVAVIEPFQSPLAVHVFGLFVVTQVSFSVLPGFTTADGTEVRDTTGTSGGNAVAVAVAVANPVPALFEQVKVKEYDFILLSVWVFSDPLEFFVPLQSPLALHEVGLLLASQTNVVF